MQTIKVMEFLPVLTLILVLMIMFSRTEKRSKAAKRARKKRITQLLFAAAQGGIPAATVVSAYQSRIGAPCHNCGTETVKHAAFCQNCGVSLSK